MALSQGDPTIFLTRPISAALLTAAAVAIVLTAFPKIRNRRSGDIYRLTTDVPTQPGRNGKNDGKRGNRLMHRIRTGPAARSPSCWRR